MLHLLDIKSYSKKKLAFQKKLLLRSYILFDGLNKYFEMRVKRSKKGNEYLLRQFISFLLPLNNAAKNQKERLKICNSRFQQEEFFIITYSVSTFQIIFPLLLLLHLTVSRMFTKKMLVSSFFYLLSLLTLLSFTFHLSFTS